MNVAIITLQPYANMGGVLQAYALQKVVKDMGHKCYQLCWWTIPYPKAKLLQQSLVQCMNLLPKGVQKWMYYRLPDAINRPLSKAVISKNTYQFIYKYVSYYPKPISKLLATDFDAFITGSDQLWRYFERTFDWRTFLDFTQDWDVTRLSYAASFGKDNIDDYPKAYKEEVKVLLKKYKAISVREKSGIAICKDDLGVNAIQLIDPTLLLMADDYRKLVAAYKKTLTTYKGLMCYVLDESESVNKLVEKISNAKGLESFHTNSNIDDKLLPPFERIQMPVEQWLKSFDDADCVITDSFHACVFSIIFHKPFLVIGNKQRGMARFESLLELFDLQYCLVDEDQIDNVQMPVIDYAAVDTKLRTLQVAAFEYLKNNLIK